MRATCWIVVHFINTILTLGLWIAALVILSAEVHFAEQYDREMSYASVEATLTSSMAAVFFLLHRMAHGYASLRAVLGQVNNPLMLRSASSQILAGVYFVISVVAVYFILLSHGSLELRKQTQAGFALQWVGLLILVCNYVLAAEQFSHPQLLYCCDNAESRTRRRLQTSGTPMRPVGRASLIEEVQDVDEDMVSLDME